MTPAAVPICYNCQKSTHELLAGMDIFTEVNGSIQCPGTPHTTCFQTLEVLPSRQGIPTQQITKVHRWQGSPIFASSKFLRILSFLILYPESLQWAGHLLSRERSYYLMSNLWNYPYLRWWIHRPCYLLKWEDRKLRKKHTYIYILTDYPAYTSLP